MRPLLFTLGLLFFGGYQSYAQLSRTPLPVPKGVSTIKGDYYFDHKNYPVAIDHYSKCIKQNGKDTHAMLRLAESYHKIQKDELAVQWYDKAFAVDPGVDESYILKYISVLNALGRYEEQKRWIATYHDKINKTRPDGQHILHRDSAVYILHHLKTLNSEKSESGPFLYQDKLIFSSNRGVASNTNFKFYKATLDAKHEFGQAVTFHEVLTSGQNHGAIAIPAGSPKLFFTQTAQSSTPGEVRMEIAYCEVPANASSISKVNKLTFKNFDHSMGHPTLNSKGTVMIFAASSPRHTRGFDLYKSEYNGKKWSTPVAFGHSINTHGDELYPNLHHDSVLYFASNAKGGMGGFDIYKVNIFDKHHRVEHLKAPVNSPFNDFGLVVSEDGTEGYLSSDRPGGLGGDDLYKIYILPVKRSEHTSHKNPSNHETLFIYTSKGDEIKLIENNKGNLKFDFTPGRTYSLTVEYDNFTTGTVNIPGKATPLPKLNIYTFDIQKSAETHAQKDKNAPIRNIHINPGDLVTFQLIPNLTTDSWADVGKIQFHNSETIIGDRESMVFSYVAAGGPKNPEQENTAPVAGPNVIDTVSSISSVAERNDKANTTSNTSNTKSGTAAETLASQIKDKQVTPADPIKETSATPTLNPSASEKPVVTTATQNTGEKSIASDSKESLASSTQASQGESKANTLPDPRDGMAKNNASDNASQLSADKVALPVQVATSENKNVKSTDGNRTQDKAESVVVADSKSLTSAGNEKAVSPDLKENQLRSTKTSEVTDSKVNALSASADGLRQPNASEDRSLLSTAKVVLPDQVVSSENKDAQSNGENKVEDKTDSQNTVAGKTELVLADNKSSLASSQTNSLKSSSQNPDVLPTNNPTVLSTQTGNDPIKDIDPVHMTGQPKQTDQNSAEGINALSDGSRSEKSIHQNGVVGNQNNTPGKLSPSTPLANAQSKEVENSNEIIRNDKNTEKTAKSLKPEAIPAETSVADTKLPDISNSVITENTVTKSPSAVSTSDQSSSESSNEFEYRVQIAASKSELSEANLKKIYRGSHEVRVFKEDGYFKYFIDQASNYPSAKRSLQESHVDQAFITVYKNNVKWKLNEAIAFQKNADQRQSSGKSDAVEKEPRPVIAKQLQNKNTATDPLSDATAITNRVPNTDPPTQPVAASSTSFQDNLQRRDAGLSKTQANTDDASSLVTDTRKQNTTTLRDEMVANTKTVDDNQGENLNSTPDTREGSLTKEDNTFQYRVQLAATKTRLNETRLKKLYNGSKEVRVLKEDDLYKYYLPATSNYFVARQIQKECKVENAFISVYKGDNKWSLQEAIALQYKVPKIESELPKTDSIVKIITVNFGLDEFVLAQDQVTHLRETVINKLKTNDTYHTIVNGYTDIQGTEEYNFGLSQERAFFVQQLIIKEGIDSQKVKTQYFGESQVVKYCPKHERCDDSIHQANRRVEVLLLTDKK